MRRFFFLISGLIFIASILHGQKPVALQTLALFKGRQPLTVTLFNPGKEAKEDIRQYVDQAYSFTLRQNTLQQISDGHPGLLRIHLPEPYHLDLDLFEVAIISESGRIRTSDGREFIPDPDHLFYRGIISGNPNSLAIMSVMDGKVQIVYSDEYGNKRIQPTHDGNYVAFEDKNIKIPKNLDCFVDDTYDQNPFDIPGISTSRMLTGNCVEVYIECDYKSYLDNGSSVANTEAWVEALWNEVITLYDNESIPVMVSDIFVYTSSDPFAGLNSTSAVLNAFVSHIDTLNYNGRLAHFMSTRPLGGGIAYLDVLCSTTLQCAVSTSLTTTIVQFPTYSWNVEVCTHEMGHNMGSSHTHACVWNGNNTQIDDCGNQWAANNGQTPEGASCYNPNSPILPTGTGGTIMSYCHLIANVGINFNNGFGTQPGNLIRNRYNNASCNTGTCAPPSCTSMTDPVPNSINVDVNSILYWATSQGANGYYLTVGTTPGGTQIMNNVDVGLVTNYDPPGSFPYSSPVYVKIVPYNNLGPATNCQEQSFVTEPNIPPTCTHLTSPVNGATNVGLTAVLHWAHSIGNQTGYKITIGTTPAGGEIANQLNVGNVNLYDPPGLLPFSSTIYVKITPYSAAGDVPGCTTESFTTLTPINGDFCSQAISLPCGSSIAGNTSQALDDPEAFTCGTDITAPGLWYTFVGNGQNTVIATCSQYSFDTKLNAYSGTCSSLTCVTGIDDYCNTGSLISFPTTNGVTYYVLVQGWDGQVGSYTITRTCYSGPFYCPSQGNNSANEWVSNFSCAGYVKASGSSHYSDYTNENITMARGGSYPVQITPSFAQGTRTEYFRVWIDLNKDGDFVDSGEEVFAPAAFNGMVSGTITIPIGTATGITRMRVSMRYNNIPPNCGAYGYGEVEDYGVNIRCNLVTSTSDSGNGSLRNVSMCADDLENVLFAPSLNGQTINVTTGPLVVDGLWKWMPDNGTNITIKAGAGVTRLLTVPSAKSIEIQYLTLIGGTTTPGSTIDNAGTVTLRNSHVKPATGSSAVPVRNQGTMLLIGSSDIVH
jgi:hypothetical protein